MAENFPGGFDCEALGLAFLFDSSIATELTASQEPFAGESN